MPKTLTPEQKIIRYQRCAECGERLTEWLNPHTHERFIACSRNENHRITARKYEQPPQLVYELWREEMTNAIGPVKTNKLERYYGAGALAEADLNKIISTIWPKAPPVEQYKALMLCKQYNLNPLRNQVSIIPFGQAWVTVLGIKANRQIAADSGSYSYLDNTPRLMSEDEQKQIMGMVDTNNLWAITKLKDAKGNVAQGYGNWPKAKAVQGADKGNTPFNMACIRSERQALDRLRPGTMPQDVEVIDEQYAPKIEAVDTATGEIIEGPPAENSEDPWDNTPAAVIDKPPELATTDEIKALQALAKSKGHTKETWDALIWQECALGTMKGITRENLAKLQEALNKQPVKI